MAGGIVLCAGSSTRLGRPKALLEAGGEPAVARVVRVLVEAGAEPVVVLGSHAESIRPAVPSTARTVVNPRWELGRTGSVKAGLEALPPTADAIVWPVDHPAVQPSTVRALLAGATPIRVPRFQGRRGHPTFFAAALRREILALTDDRPLHDVVRALPRRVGEVEVDDAGILLNVDTPDDLKRLQELLGGPAPARSPA